MRRATALLAEVRAAVDNWKAFASEAELPAVTTDRWRSIFEWFD